MVLHVEKDLVDDNLVVKIRPSFVVGKRAGAFAFLPELNTIELPSTLRTIECRAFQGCDSLTHIHIPTGVRKVHIDALWADNLKEIVMESSVPPEMTGYIRDDEWRYRDVSLLVPKDAVNAYEKASGWKSFNVKAK